MSVDLQSQVSGAVERLRASGPPDLTAARSRLARRRRRRRSGVALGIIAVLFLFVTAMLVQRDGDSIVETVDDPPAVDGSGQSVGMLDGTKLDVRLPDQLAGYVPVAWAASIETEEPSAARVQVSVLAESYAAWTSRFDSVEDLGPTASLTTRRVVVRSSGEAEREYLVYDGGTVIGHTLVGGLGVAVPDDLQEALAAGVRVSAGSVSPLVSITSDFDWRWTSAVSLHRDEVLKERTEELELIGDTSCLDEPSRPFMIVRCFPDVRIRAVLHRSNGDVAALDTLAIAGVPDAHVSSYPECPVLAVESGDPGPIAVTPDRQLAVHDDAGSGSFEYRARVGNKIPVEVARRPGTPIEVTAQYLETGEMVLWEYAEPGRRPVGPTPVMSGATSPVASGALGTGASTAVLGISVDEPAVVLFDFSSDGWSSQVCVAFTSR